jgi:hypothetical protein
MPRKGKSQTIRDLIWVPSAVVTNNWAGPGYFIVRNGSPELFLQVGTWDSVVYPLNDTFSIRYASHPAGFLTAIRALRNLREEGPLRKATLQRLFGDRWKAFVDVLRTQGDIQTAEGF